MPKHRTQEERDKAAADFVAKRATVQELLKRHQVSRPAIYQWINSYKARHPEGTAAQVRVPTSPSKVDANESLEQRVARLERENVLLRKRLFDLMVETGRI